MAIELYGDLEAISAMGFRVPETGSTNSQTKKSNFKTVCIPDIRIHEAEPDLTTSYEMVSDFTAPTEAPGLALDEPEMVDSVSELGTTTVNRATTLTSLQAIKESIEDQSGTDASDSILQDLTRVDSRVTRQDPEMKESNPVGEIPLTLEPKSEAKCFLSRIDPKDRQIAPIAESILQKFPLGGTSIVAFAGTERNEQLEMIVASTAVALRNSKPCRVLVIDSDVNGGFLTEMMGAADRLGLTDLAGANTWENVLEPTCDVNIHFLPLGKKELAFPEKLEILLKRVVPNVMAKYDFVLVNVGDAHDPVAELWSNFTNGTFLLVSMTDTNQNIAKSAVAQLNSCGARLIGCVVSDSLE